MRYESPALAPFLRSDAVGRILAATLLSPDAAHSVTELSRKVGAPYAVTHKEVARLETAGILTSTRVGRTRVVRANPGYRQAVHLTALIAATYGPVPVLSEALRPVAGVEEAYIFGSWAARHEGVEGPQPGDVDVLVIGTADRRQLNAVAHAAEQRLDLPVSMTKVSREAWQSSDDPFIRTVRSRPLTRLELQENIGSSRAGSPVERPSTP